MSRDIRRTICQLEKEYCDNLSNLRVCGASQHLKERMRDSRGAPVGMYYVRWTDVIARVATVAIVEVCELRITRCFDVLGWISFSFTLYLVFVHSTTK